MTVEIQNGITSVLSKRTMTLRGDTLDLRGKGIDFKHTDQLSIELSDINGDANSVSAKAGGLVVVINIDGGGH